MKTFASFALYVLSIVVAVGIGMAQAGKVEPYTIGATSECKQGTKESECAAPMCGMWTECETKEPGKGADSCTETPNASCYDASNNKPSCTKMNNRKPSASLTYSECKAGG